MDSYQLVETDFRVHNAREGRKPRSTTVFTEKTEQGLGGITKVCRE